MVEKKVIEEYQALQEQYKVVVLQKESIKLQLFEMENAIKELEQSKDEFAFQIIGNIMVRKNREDLLKELKESKEELEVRINNLEKMEKFLEEKIKEKETIIKEGE